MNGITFLSEQQRSDFDRQIKDIAEGLLQMTKASGNTSMDYDYNCAIGGYRFQLDRLSKKIEALRLEDKAKSAIQS